VVGARRRRPAQLLNAARQVVALTLELAEVGQAGRPRGHGGAWRAGCRDVREASGDDPRQLVLEAGDLCLQRLACGSFGAGLQRPIEHRLLLHELRHFALLLD